jgi:phospholipase/carboxylesterase
MSLLPTVLHAPPAGSPPQLLFVLLHGVGQRARHLSPLAERLGAEYPLAAVIGLDAPEDFDGLPGPADVGRQWFSTQGLSDANRPERVAKVLPALAQAVRDLTNRLGLDWERTALAGFSQGAIVALEAVQTNEHLAGRVLAFSGRYATPPPQAPLDATVHWLHGMADAVIPPAIVVDTAERLLALGADVTADVLPHIAHELHPLLVDKAIEQLRTFIPKRVWRQAMSEAPLVARQASSRELGQPPGDDQPPD